MQTSIRRSLATVALAAFAVGGLTACGEDEPAEFDAVEQETQENAEPTTGDKEPATGGEQAEDKATDRPEDGPAPATEPAELNIPDNAIETITFEVPGADERDEATVTVGFHGLRVDGEVMVLELSFTPEFRNDNQVNLRNMYGNERMLPVLNDRVNLKQYTVLGSSGGGSGWATDNGPHGHEVSSGQTLQYWAHFAAPEDDIDTINVGLDLVEFTDVRIER